MTSSCRFSLWWS